MIKFEVTPNGIEHVYLKEIMITNDPGGIRTDLTMIKKLERSIVVISESKKHKTPSISNSISLIRNGVNNALRPNIEPIWIEHYSLGEGEYSLMEVDFQHGEPHWNSLTTWEALAEKYGVPAEILAQGYPNELTAASPN
jgi:hypothetical protein